MFLLRLYVLSSLRVIGMSQRKWKIVGIWLVRLLVAGVLGWAGLAKAIWVDRDTLVGRWSGHVPGLRWALIGLEWMLALWLLSGWQLRQAATATALVLLVFMGILAVDVNLPHPVPCGCLRRSATQPWNTLLVIQEEQKNDAQVRRDLWLAIGRNSGLVFALAWLRLQR